MGILRRVGIALFALGGVCATACGSERSDEPPAETQAARTVLVASPRAAARIAELRAKLPGAGTAWLHDESSKIAFETDGASIHPTIDMPRARVALPTRADQPARLTDAESGVAIEFSLLDANPAAVAEVSDGLVVYRGALGGADVIHRPGSDGTEDFVVYERAPRRPSVAYRVDVRAVPGLRLVANTLELLDRDGTPRLRVQPPYVVDASGERHAASLDLEGCAVDQDPAAPWGRAVVAPGNDSCEVRVSWDARLAYPLVVDPAWTTTEAMVQGRLRHTATLLSTTGKVLIAGGCLTQSSGPCGGTASAELYDPPTKTYATTGSLPAARGQHTATRLNDGRVLVAGGVGGTALATAVIYNPSGGTFSATGSLSAARFSHTATLLQSGKVLVAGGTATVGGGNASGLSSAQVFDPAAGGGVGAFVNTGNNLGTGRKQHTATLLGSGKVLIAGGRTSGAWGDYDTAISSAEIFDPAGTGSFSGTGAMSSQRAAAAAGLLPNGKVLVAAGGCCSSTIHASSEIYDTGTGAFTPGPPLFSERAGHTFTKLPSGGYLVYGGQTSVSPTGGGAPPEVFDPSNGALGAFATTVPAPAPHRMSHAASELPNGNVLVVGGVIVLLLGVDGAATGIEYGLDAQGAACTSGITCGSGFCADGFCCDQACTGACKACSAAKKGSGANGACGNIPNNSDPDAECADQGATTCGTDGFCDGAGACGLYPSGTVCSATSCTNGVQSASTCNGTGNCVPTNTSCAPYVCAGTACASSCSSHAGCVTNHFCQGTSCVPDKPDSQSCASGAECISGNCVDGVCCDSPCAGTCVACTAALKGSGSNGVCGNIAAGTDPQSDCNDLGVCQQNGLCSGSGSCQLYPSGTACGATTCSNGTQTGSSCDGFGICAPSSTTSCAPYFCANGSVCAVSCVNNAGCIANHWCQTSTTSCLPDKANGESCGAAAECISGFCVDGVCCDQACTGACRACSSALKGSGADGNCGFIGAGTDPSNECTDQGASTCDQNGFCNGSGACQLYANGTACQTTSCSNGTQTGYACNGFGTCSSGSTTSCAPYVCANASVCATTCSTDAGCVPTYYCDTDSKCKADLPNEQACTKSAMCTSGNCVDGFCCDSPCGGTCQACSAVKKGGGSNGVCGAVAADTDPDNDCADQGQNSCGFDGLCSGAASCGYYASGTACNSTTCTGGVQTGNACDGAGSCDSGQTTLCGPYFCQGSACGQSCASDSECVPNHFCSAASECKPDQPNGSACSKTSQCISGNCVDGVCCDQACTSACKACSSAKKGGGADGVCDNVVKDTDPDNDCTAQAPGTCKEDGECNGLGVCQKWAAGTSCGPNVCSNATLTGQQCDGSGACTSGATNPCPNLFSCTDPSACATSCTADAQCVGSAFCDATECKPKKDPGDACDGDNQCASGFCVDGVCCNTGCTGLCQACASISTGQPDGTCTFALDGQDPHDSCTDQGAAGCDNDGFCNGSGACRLYPQGSPCGSVSCVQNNVTGYLCDGSGTCDSSSTQDCGAYLCEPSGCTTSCASSSKCASDGYCDSAGACQEKKDTGQSCDSGDQCVSTFCVDGYCCAGPCTGQCEACDVPAAEGQCVPVSGAPHGDTRPPCDPAPADEPCLGSACDGVVRTSCEGLAGSEVSCREASCDPETGVATFAAACNGKGTCPELQTELCSPYVCAGDTCGKKPCVTDADCAAIFRCALTAGAMDCIPKDASTCDLKTHTVTSPTGEMQDCAPYNCNVTGNCNESCSTSTDCSEGNFCNTKVSPGRCQAPAEAASEESGCGCRVGADDDSRGRQGWLLLLFGVLFLGRRGRSKKSR